MPFSYLEKQVFKRGYQVVAGIDEAGRGSLAGPVAAAIVALRGAQTKVGATWQSRGKSFILRDYHARFARS